MVEYVTFLTSCDRYLYIVWVTLAGHVTQGGRVTRQIKTVGAAASRLATADAVEARYSFGFINNLECNRLIQSVS